ncbi:MAG: tryptophan--tRNA ligase [Verrucomicrobiota bacterium]|nr:tryptophan--tRNA ligase [Verrucomicrobiota bacterium]MDY5598041.1 tryptophan--tRNA ligase [Kiritimatiellia bacterium]
MRILTGIQPSGKLHWGNYFGAMKSMFDLQAQGKEIFMFIANYHAMTTVRDGAALREQTRDVALDYLACGLDPEKSIIYRQSDVMEVQELAWFLSCLTPMGLLERCHSYKDKLAHGLEATHGLFAYPVLMAADILIMNADLVPVGKDQKQHLEVTRDLAQKFNNAFGEIFKLPDAYIPETVATIPGTDGQKMSKSYHNAIELFEPNGSIKKKVMGIVTDSKTMEEPKEPEGNAIYELYKLFATPDEVAEMAANFRAGNYGYGHAKKALLEAYHRLFDPFRARREELAKDTDTLEDILKAGAEKARAAAMATMEKVRTAVGL